MESPRPFVLVPGAWIGAWVWEPVADALRRRGHPVVALTLAGLEPPAAPDAPAVPDPAPSAEAPVTLATHVDEVLVALERDDLRDVVLVGHSYSGVVVGQVPDRAPDRITHTVYVDAFLPHDGRAMLDAFPPAQREVERRDIAARGGRWPAPDAAAIAEGHGLSADQARWLAARLVDHPGRTVTDPVVLRRPLADQRATYIAGAFPLGDGVAALRQSPTWTFRALDAGHWPMVAARDALVALLAEAAAP